MPRPNKRKQAYLKRKLLGNDRFVDRNIPKKYQITSSQKEHINEEKSQIVDEGS